MKNQIIIHIGYPKTGTTWLQNSLFPKIKNYTCVERDFILKELILINAFEFNEQKAQQVFYNQYGNDKNVIISLEGFVGTTYSSDLNGFYSKEVAIRLKKVFPEAKIMIGIRNQLTIIPSTYLQYIRGGGTHNVKNYLFHQFYNEINGMCLFSFRYLNMIKY